MTFAPLFVPAGLRRIVSDAGWLEGMLEAERALARAQARAGVIPGDAADEIAACCRSDHFDVAELAEQGRAAGNPAEPLVRALRARVGGETAAYVHLGATSQDIVDSAAMLVTRDALATIDEELAGAAAACAGLTLAHRSTVMAGRTLLQQAVPTTFGAKAAGWLVALVEGRARLRTVRETRLAVQLGGAAGTLALLGDTGLEVLRRFALELGLAEPVLPWHTDRGRLGEVGGALGIVAGATAKIGLDVVLLAQTEVGEVAEAAGGVSSTMPHKRNPVGATLARACATLAQGHAALLATAGGHEHERAAGLWQAEWPALSGALAYTGGAVAAIRSSLEGLEVAPARMRANLDATGGLVVSERISGALSTSLGHAAARELVSSCGPGELRAALLADPRVTLSAAEVDELLDPAGYLGSAEAFVDRALALHRGSER